MHRAKEMETLLEAYEASRETSADGADEPGHLGNIHE
jgi:hypothetical protein